MPLQVFILLQDGRLGNQILQYFSACEASNSSWLILLGYSQLRVLLRIPTSRQIFLPSFFDLILKILNPLRHRYRYKKDVPGPFVDLVTEQPISTLNPSAPVYLTTKNIAPFQIFHNFFALHQSLHKQRLIQNAQVSSSYKQQSLHWLESQSTNLDRAAFVHIRLGDFQQLSRDNTPYVLSPSYYRNALSKLLSLSLIDDLILLTDADDASHALSLLPKTNLRIIPGPNNPLLAWAVMNHLRYGILSASTFSLSAVLVGLDNKHSYHYVRPAAWPSSGYIDQGISRNCQFDELIIADS